MTRSDTTPRDHATPPSPQVANDLITLRNDARREFLRRRTAALASVPGAPNQVRRW